MQPLQVAVGVIKNTAGEILISLRDVKLHQGGLWEFPGGKIEEAESAEQALARELKEELDIDVISATPLLKVDHQYPDVAVQLFVFSVENYLGEAKNHEGQPFKWVAADDLPNYRFPAANQPIITAARLPPYYAILGDSDYSLLQMKLNKLLDNGIKLIQARLKAQPNSALETFIYQAYPQCKQHQAKLILNSECANRDVKCDGVHLTSRHLLALTKRPETAGWVAASCHNLEELRHAQNIGVDFAVLAPVMPTPTHLGVENLGWGRFAELVAQVNFPVYALGGLNKADLRQAQQSGGQGIAAVRAFLD